MKQWLQNQLAVAHQQARGIDPMLCQSRASAEELGQHWVGGDIPGMTIKYIKHQITCNAVFKRYDVCIGELTL